MFSYQMIFFIVIALCLGLMLVKKKDSLYDRLKPGSRLRNNSSKTSNSYYEPIHRLGLPPEEIQEFERQSASLTEEYIANELIELHSDLTSDQRFELAKLMVDPAKRMLLGFYLKDENSNLLLLGKLAGNLDSEDKPKLCVLSLYFLATITKPMPVIRKWAVEYLQIAKGDEDLAHFFGIMRHFYEQAVDAEYFYKTQHLDEIQFVRPTS